MIEIYLLEQLVAVAKCGTLSAAAEHLHMTQPALSKSMQKLENLIEITLFERKKNKISINETGELAAELAEQILKQEENMLTRLRHFDKSRHTISLGSCAPIPIAEIVPLLSQNFSNFTISSFLEDDEVKLINDLYEEQYQLIVLSYAPDDDSLYIKEYSKEQLYLLVPKAHPLSKFDQLHFSDFDGQNILLHSKIGSWNDLARTNLPKSHFMVMDNLDALSNVFETGSFPAFTTDVMIQSQNNLSDDVKAIPIQDEAATMHYYCICKKSNQEKFDKIFQTLSNL
ncbi:putative transcriptional regulator [Lachnospiraceae bacterium KM106-2]|nr:putative transcriptional regulator [Lachnospiraceae bacterium KM106-2]